MARDFSGCVGGPSGRATSVISAVSTRSTGCCCRLYASCAPAPGVGGETKVCTL